MEVNKVMDCIVHLKAVFIKDNLKLILSTAMDTLLGLMEKSIRDFGKITKCMERVILSGLMDEDIKENILMIKNKVLDSLCGMMDVSIKDSGRTGNKMVEECLRIEMENKKLAFGVMAKR